MRTHRFSAAALLVAMAGMLPAQSIRAVYNQLSGVRLPVPAASATRGLLNSGNDKIDPGLRLLVNETSSRGIGSFDSAARALVIPTSGDLVDISVTAENDSDTVRRLVEASGGEIDGIVDGAVLAKVPLDAIEKLGANRNVAYVSRQGMYYADAVPNYGGTELVKVRKLHEKGYVGKGVKVGVLDFGFGGYHAQESQGVVPRPVAAKFFGNSTDWAVGVEHGSACVEIVHAMAPEAQIYIAMVGDGSGRAGDGDIKAAADWLVEQKVDIISFSGGGHDGPHDGRAVLNKVVDQVTAKGILWVNAAGNEGDSHWSGPARDADRDGWMDIGPKGEPFLAVQAQGNTAVFLINWNDWGADPLTPTATQDLDAYLYSWDPNTQQAKLVAQSTNPQNGRGAPREFLGAQVVPGQIYLVALKMVHITQPVRVHIFSLAGGTLYPVVKAGSVGIPGTSAAALTVAAVDVTTGKLESYSSQGPTDDDRIKPDLAGPDNDVSSAYGKRFQGTSAACPHVAGFAAVIRQMNPNADLNSFRRMVVQMTRKMADQAPNNETGSGIIDGDVAPAEGGRERPAISDSLEIPSDLGGHVSIAALDRLRGFADESASSSIAPKVVTGHPEYNVGEGLKIGFRVDEDCYYLLVHRDTTGHYTLLAPGPDSSGMLRAGKYAEPSGEKTFRITPPGGIEEVLLICARSPVDLNSLQTGSNGKSVAVAIAQYKVVE